MQLDIFSSIYTKFRFTKPIRLVELFAGYGSQALALKYLGIEFEHYKVIEFDKYAIGTYNELHNTNFETRDILKVQDLEIVETNKYDYLMTYSFPCTDLSLAGKGGGMHRESNTRSGLLWEVERLLKTSKELPRVLMMENVPQIHSNKHLPDFIEWMSFLESLGYKNYWQDLNAKNYGIPQTRNRTFMISVLGDYSYTFPTGKKLELKLKDMLEEDVSEKYYLSEEAIHGRINTNYEKYKLKNNLLNDKDIPPSILARFEGSPTLLKIPEATKKGYALAKDGDGVYIDRPHQKRGVVQKGMIQTLKCTGNDLGVVVMENYGTVTAINSEYELSPKMKEYINSYDDKYKVNDKNLVANREIACSKTTREGQTRADASDYISPDLQPNTNVAGEDLTNLRIRKLTPRECFRLMGVKDADIDKITCSNSQKYKQAGNSIVVDVLMAIFKEMMQQPSIQKNKMGGD